MGKYLTALQMGARRGYNHHLIENIDMSSPNDNKSTPPPTLFGGNTAPGTLFGVSNAPGGGLFGNGPKQAGLFGAPPTGSPQPSLFGSMGQQTPAPSLFGNPQPPAQPPSGEAKSTSLFGGLGGKSTLFQNRPSPTPENNTTNKAEPSTNSNTLTGSLGLFGQNPQQSLFGASKANDQETKSPASNTPPQSTSLFGNTPAMTLSFGSKQEPKKDTPTEKKEEPKSLFGGQGGLGSGALFGGNQQAGSLFGSQPAKHESEKKQEGQKPVISSLFGSNTPSAPKKEENTPTQPNQTPKQVIDAKERPKVELVKQNPAGLFTNAPSSLFGGNNPLFGGLTPAPKVATTGAATSTTPAPTLAPSLFSPPTGNQQPSLFGSSGAPPSLFGSPPAPPITKPSETQPSPTQQPKIASTSFFGQNLPTSNNTNTQQASKQPTVQTSKPVQSLPKLAQTKSFITEEKDLKKSTVTAPSLFGATSSTPSLFSKPKEPATVPTQKPETLNTMSEPKPTIEPKPMDDGLSSFTENRRKQPISIPIELQPPKAAGRSNESDSSSLFTTKEKTQNDLTTRDTKNTGTAQSAAPKMFSFLKPRETNTSAILDYKILRQEEKRETFNTFLAQSARRVIESIKMYFTVRSDHFKPREVQIVTEKERFLLDFTNLFVKVLGLTDQSWDLASQFIRRIITQQRYQKVLFKDDSLVGDYFKTQIIYQSGLGQTFFLNETSSRELQFLVEKVVSKWNVERVGVLNLLQVYSELMEKPSDLFAYLFKHLLEMDKKMIETPNQQCRSFICDLDAIAKHKLTKIISIYNKQLKDYRMMSMDEIKAIIRLIETSKDDTTNELSLKVLLNSINFKQPKEVSADVLDLIKQTKSFVMMPLRALVHRLHPKRHEFVPSPKDLYKYIRGDEWIDWFDIYLSDSGKEGLELQVGEPEQILQSLCTISGHLLLERMLSAKKGVLRFFNLLRDENLVSLYYRLLQACIHSEQAISEVNEFYFRRMNFNLQYQEIIQYVLSFSQHQTHANEQAVLAILQVKMSLLAKILEVSPQRLVELERYLFYHDYNRLKKFKTNTAADEMVRPEGQKIVHLFLDTINITSLKGISNRILHRIFRVLTHLLKNQQTQRVVLAALRMNRPSFSFMQTALHPLTLNALNDFLQQILSGSYLHELVFAYPQAKEDEIRMEAFYPFRYRDAEFCNLLRHEQMQGESELHFSIYWLNQVVKVINKQKFNPYLLFKIMEKLHIEPYNSHQNYMYNEGNINLFQKSKMLQSKIPTIFEPLVSCINDLTVWEDITRVLEFKIVRIEGKLDLTNKMAISNQSQDSYRCLLYTLKLVRLAFKLNSLLAKHEETSSGHFVVRTLSAVNFLSRGKIGSQLSSNSSKNSILLSVLASLQFQHPLVNDTFRSITWEAEQADEDDKTYQALISYINNQKQISFDFEVANNFLKRPLNEFYQAQNSILAVSLDVLVQIVRLSPQCSLEHTLTAFLPLKEDEKIELRTQILSKLTSAVNGSMEDPHIDYRIIEFIYNLKHNCGSNRLHGSLSNRLFDQFIKNRKRVGNSAKFNSILCKYLLGQLQAGNYNYEAFTQQFLQGIVSELHFRDSFSNNYYEFKDTKQIGRMVRHYHGKQYSLLNLNQVERMVDQRAIIEIGFQFDTLRSIVDILMAQMLRRKHSQSLINCLCLFNSLLHTNNLLMLDRDLPNEFRTAKPSTILYNNEEPRLYIRDPVELYITQGRTVSRKGEAQLHQKNNIIQWLLDRCQSLADKINNYIKFILTIDRYLYANNPVVFTVDRPDIANINLFCHLSLGKMNFNATEIFGKSTSDSIEAVQGIATNIINRLVEARKNKEEYSDQPYREGLKILGYCLEWLRNKVKYGESTESYLVRKLHKNYTILLPQPNRFLNSEAIKVLMSAISIGEKYFSNEAKAHIHQAVYSLIERYWMCMQKGFIEEQGHLVGELFQQAISLLILIPPDKNEAFVFEMLINIWTKQRNFQFFFNESRLMLELAKHCPQEVVKLQPLTRCEIITALSDHYSRYSDDERRFDSIAWTWVVKVATELANHPLSILVVSEVSAFFKQYRGRFLDLFQPGEKITKSYLEDLEAALQLLSCIFSHDLWVNFNRKLAEEMTYLLSHKLIKVFVQYAQGKLSFLPISSNDKALSAVKTAGAMEEETTSAYDNMTQDNMFVTEMRIRMNYCMRDYCLVMRRAFKASHYVQAYFQSPVVEGCRYFSSFWDIFNKHLVSLFVFAGKQFKVWNGVRKLNEALSTLTQCCSAPHSFVENGYLSTVLDLPTTEFQLFSDIYLLNYLLSELAAVHLLKQRLYVTRFNNLMASHIEVFSKRLKEHVDSVKVESRKVNIAMSQYVSEGEFNGIVELIDSGRLVAK